MVEYSPRVRVNDMSHLSSRFLLLLVLAPAACTGEPLPATGKQYTYYQDVKPIIGAKCAGCHHGGDTSAPFALEKYADVYQRRAIIRSEVVSKRMPPWSPNNECRSYNFDRSLTKEQLATFTAWLDQGAPQGSSASEGAALEVDLQKLSRVDMTVRMPEPYTPVPSDGDFDDHRCFLMDFPLPATQFITGLQVAPGNASVVHHVIVFSVKDTDTVNKIKELEAEDARPGWNCVSGGDIAVSGSLGGWSPGAQATLLPKGLGNQIEPGGKIVLNMHYNTLFSKPGVTDQTSVKFQFAKFAQQSSGTGILDPAWLLPGGMKIKAGEKDAKFRFSYRPSIFTLGLGFFINSATMHMHQLGKSGKLWLTRSDGSEECLLQVDDFNFHWGGEYWFQVPVRVERDDRLEIECHFDNSAENQAVHDGKPLVPQDIEWGGAAPNEMCAGIFSTSY